MNVVRGMPFVINGHAGFGVVLSLPSSDVAFVQFQNGQHAMVPCQHIVLGRTLLQHFEVKA